MKIVVTAGGIIWNECHPALQKYGNDIVTVRRTPDVAAELVARVGADRNVLVLTDNDPRSFMPLQVLTKQFRSRRIHLFVCLPFAYESTRRKREILELLGDLCAVKTLCLVELDTFLNEAEKDETLGGLQLRIRNSMIGLIDRAVTAMEGLDELTRYRFDFAADTYREDDFSALGDELAAKLLTKRKNAPLPEDVVPEEAGRETAAPEPQTPETQTPEPQTPESQAPEPQAPEPQTPEAEKKPAPKKRRSLFALLSKRKV